MRRDLSIFWAAISDSRVCASERRLNNTRRHLLVSRGYTHPLRPVYTRFAGALCLLYAGFSEVVCSRFEFARHFESHLSRPPPFYMRMRTTISDEHSIVTMLRSTRIIFSTYSFSQHVRIHHLWNNYVPDRYNRF